MNCEKCGHEMTIFRGGKWVCSNEECDNIKIINGISWNEALAEDKALWNPSIISNAPSIVAYEYDELRAMLGRGEVSGIILRIKDTFEVILKLPVLIVLSEGISTPNHKNLYNEALYKLTYKLPSLGDWHKVGTELLKVVPDNMKNYAPVKILQEVLRIYDKYQIVTWRNNNIGHGVYTSVESEKIRNEVIEKIKILLTHIGTCAEAYQEIRLIIKYGNKNIELKGSENARQLPYNNRDLYAVYNGKIHLIVPLLRNINKSIYFFDSYISNRGNSCYLDYVMGDKYKTKDKDILNLVKSVRKLANVSQLTTSAENDIYMKSLDTAVEKVLLPDEILVFDFIGNRLKKFMEANTKGKFLLQMEDGMGKTTLVKSYDRLAYGITKLNRDTICRGIYINPIYMYSKLSFVNALRDALRTLDNRDTLVGNVPNIDVDSENCREQLAVFLNKMMETYREQFGKSRMVIFIDGLDELPNVGKNSFLDLLPNSEELADNIYIVCTCRTEKELSEYITYQLSRVTFEEMCSFTNSEELYRQEIIAYLMKNNGLTVEEASKILSLSEGRMLNISKVLQAYFQYGESFIINVEVNYFKILRMLYGEAFYKEMMRVLTVIVLSPVPLSIKEIAILLGEEEITFKQIAFLGELKALLNISHNEVGTYLSVTRKEVVEVVRSSEFMQEILASYKNYLVENYANIEQIEYNTYELMFLSLTYADNGYVDEFNKEKKLAKIITAVVNNNICDESFDYSLKTKILLTNLFNNIIPNCKYDKEIGKLATKLGECIFNILYFYRLQSMEFMEKLVEICERDNKVISNASLSGIYAMYINILSLNNEPKLADEILLKKENLKSTNKKKITSVEKYLEEKRSKVYELWNEGIFYKNDAQLDRAIIKCNEALKIIDEIKEFNSRTKFLTYPLAMQIYILLGNIYKRKDINKSIDYLEKALEYYKCYKEKVTLLVKEFNMNKESIPQITATNVLINLGQAYRAAKQYDKARETLDTGIEIEREKLLSGQQLDHNQLSNYYCSRGNVELDCNNNDLAIEFYTKGIDIINKAKNNNLEIIPRIDMNLRCSRRLANERLGNNEKMIEDEMYLKEAYGESLQEESAVQGNNPDREKQADVFYTAANRDISLGRYQSAIKKLTLAIEFVPDNINFYSDRAYCYSELGRDAENSRYAFSDVVRVILRGKISKEVIKSFRGETFDKMMCILSDEPFFIRHIYDYYLYSFRQNLFNRVLMFEQYIWYVEYKVRGLRALPVPPGTLKIKDEIIGFDNNFENLKLNLKRALHNMKIDEAQASKNRSIAEGFMKGSLSEEERKKIYFKEFIINATEEELDALATLYPREITVYDYAIKAAIQSRDYEKWEYVASLYDELEFLKIYKPFAKHLRSVGEKVCKIRT